MKERRRVAIPNIIRVDSINSIYRVDLSGIDLRGDIHDFYELVYVEEGLFSVLVDGILRDIPAGSLFVYAPSSYHIGNTERRRDAVVSIVSFASRSGAMRWFDNRMLTPSAEERSLLHSFFALAFETLRMTNGIEPREGSAPHRLQVLGNRLEELLLMLLGEEDAPSPSRGTRQAYKKERFLALAAYLKQNLKSPITLRDMADAMACSVSAVKALCREFCASGPNDYLISLRIGRARELIRESTMNFTEIAEEVGFSSLHYFSRVFKARTGETPSEYARSV